MMKSTCANKVHWLGNRSLSNITITHTPGFVTKLDEEERAIEGMANKLKNEIKYIHALCCCIQSHSSKSVLQTFKGYIEMLYMI